MTKHLVAGKAFIHLLPTTQQKHPSSPFQVMPPPSANYVYRNFDRSNMVNFGTQGHDRGVAGGGIEFRLANEEDESGVTSPPLWHVSPPTSPPTDTTPLQSQAYTHHHHYRSLSPTSRIRAIERGKAELMEMVKTMPESSYELSLKDLVEHSKLHETRQQLTIDVDKQTELGRIKKKKNNIYHLPRQISRSGSMTDNRPFLLKMFCPVPLASKKKKSSSPTSIGTLTKVSPRPVEGEKFADKDWWRRRLSVPGEREPNGSGSSSGSSQSSRSRFKVPNRCNKTTVKASSQLFYACRITLQRDCEPKTYTSSLINNPEETPSAKMHLLATWLI